VMATRGNQHCADHGRAPRNRLFAPGPGPGQAIRAGRELLRQGESPFRLRLSEPLGPAPGDIAGNNAAISGMGGRKSFVKATEARTGDTISGWNFDSNKYVIAGFSEKVLPRRAPPVRAPHRFMRRNMRHGQRHSARSDPILSGRRAGQDSADPADDPAEPAAGGHSLRRQARHARGALAG
jgi:hypothetical protein